jgi:glycosyltransferase involved in cell wall biosynthesis
LNANLSKNIQRDHQMKIFYLTVGLPHYFNLVLSKINSEPGVELIVISPKDPSDHVGPGVFQTLEGANFRNIFLEEYTIKPFIFAFKGLFWLLIKERPDLIVMPDHLLRGFQFHPGLVLLRHLLGFRLVLKSIPFLIPDFETSRDEIRAALRSERESGRGWWHWIGGLLKAGYRYLALLSRGRRFRLVDAHVVYVDEGRNVYGSYGVSSDKIFVTRNSPDTDSLAVAEQKILTEETVVRRSIRRILFVGRLVPTKRADLLIRAFRSVNSQYPDAELEVVGAGPELESLKDLVRQYSLDRVVHFAGAIYDPVQLGKAFMSSSLFVLPGLGGLSINEAMFYGLAVICAMADGTERFLVRKDVNGAFFEDGDEQDLARVIIETLSDLDRLKMMGRRSREIIEHEVNIGTVVAEYMNAFRSVLAAKQKAVRSRSAAG